MIAVQADYHFCKPFTIFMKLNSVITVKNVSFVLTNIISIYMKENKKLDKENSFFFFALIFINKIHILNIHIVLDTLRIRGAKVAIARPFRASLLEPTSNFRRPISRTSVTPWRTLNEREADGRAVVTKVTGHPV